MKYVRTNDNQIINVEKLKIDFDIKFVGNYLQVFYKFGITPVEAYEITKQADTIEELCDDFICNKQLLYPMYIDPKDTDLIAFRYRIEDEFNYKNHKEIYGAIWTDKGLIYVAKVKGVSQYCEINWELELL